MELFSGGDGTATEPLWEAQSVAQHHDAVSGTAKQAVTYDYAQRLSKGGAVADRLIEATLAAMVTTKGTPLALAYCPLANVSECDIITSYPGATIAVLLYNPTGRASDEATTLYIPSATKSPTLYDGTGKVIPSTTLPVFTNPANVQGKATYRTWFSASIPGLGVSTYFLSQGSESDNAVKGIRQGGKRGGNRFSVKSVLNEEEELPALPAVTPTKVRADPVLENAGVAVTFDDATGLIKSIRDKSTNISHPFTQDFAWYPSYQVKDQQASGAYIFRPAINGTYSLSTSTKLTQLVNGEVVSEAWQQITPWLSQIIRLRQGAHGVEFEWTVGPIPISDDQGKEVIIRFNTSFQSKGTWYTDSNGREFQQRQRNFRPTWKWVPTQLVAGQSSPPHTSPLILSLALLTPFLFLFVCGRKGNYYPVNSATWLTDGTSAMIVNVDRSQGCSSLVDGVIECMIHRRIAHDDGRGVGEALNETGLDGKGLVITGATWVHLSPLADAAYHARATATEIYSPPHQSYAPLNSSIGDYLTGHQSNVSFLKTDLPDQVELITAHVFMGKLLIRIAHSYGVGESATYSTPVTIDLSTLFLLPITDAQEMNLSGVLPKGSRTPFQWNTTGDGEVARRSVRKDAPGSVTINPGEVKTFLCTLSRQ